MSRPNNATLKRLLTKRFPATRFRVYSGRGTASSWSHADWIDGPSAHLVETFLATIGAAPGTMDNTDYFSGERVSCNRRVSDHFRRRVAAWLLSPKTPPPESEWHPRIRGANGTGYYDLNTTVHRAISRPDLHLDHARFAAHAWYTARITGKTDAPTSVCYEDYSARPIVAT